MVQATVPPQQSYLDQWQHLLENLVEYSRISQKISEKRQRYSDLKIEIQKMWTVRASVAPVIIGSLGSVPKGLKDQLQTLQIYHANLIPKMQKTVLLSSCHILRRFVTEH